MKSKWAGLADVKIALSTNEFSEFSKTVRGIGDVAPGERRKSWTHGLNLGKSSRSERLGLLKNLRPV